MIVQTWKRFDAIVLQWIYATISKDLLNTIIEPNTTAKKAWDRLQDIFQDNRNSRSLALEHQFTNIRLDNFPNVSAYCQELKMIYDQMVSVGSTADKKRLVLQLVAGLNESYATVGTYIHQMDKLPTFYAARSKLILEESTKNRQASTTVAAGAALLTTTNTNKDSGNSSSDSNSYTQRGSSSNNFRGRGGRQNHRGGRSNGRGRGIQSNTNHNWTNNPYSGPYSPKPYGPPFYPWAWPSNWPAMPPCPYPTSEWTRSNVPNSSAGILGPRPQQQQAHATSVTPSSDYTPTDIAQALHTMSLNPPDENWYMDTGASSHMTASQGLHNGNTSHAM